MPQTSASRDVPAARPRVSIVLPAYNEAKRIVPSLAELYGWLRRGGPPREGGRSSLDVGSCEVIIVDDGSTDGTIPVVETWARDLSSLDPPLRVLRERHLGKGGAVRAGMLAAKGDFVLFADADMATPPDQIPFLLDALSEHDVALGSRIHRDGSDRRKSQPLHRRLVGRAFHALAAAWVTGSVPDTQCGFKGFRAAAAEDLFGHQRTTGIVFDAEIIHLARRRGYSIATVPVHWSDKRGSRMRVRPGLALKVLVDVVRIPLLHRRARHGDPQTARVQRPTT